MNRILIIFYAIIVALTFCRTENDPSAVLHSEDDPQAFSEDLEDNIVDIESSAALAEKVIREGILPLEETEKYLDKIVDKVEDIIEMIKVPSQAYAFVKAKGIDRVFMPNLSVRYPKLRVSLLMLLKVLFELLPTTTDAVMPIYAIDKLVDIFDTDDDLGIKAHALDILAVWLVDNPRAQVRVIKMKGLEPFYRQIPKLNTYVTSSLLELFNTILEEHIRVRNDVQQRSKADSDKYVLYQRMGLIERVSTRSFCEGLLNVFYTTWSHTISEVPMPVLKLIKNTLPYCVEAHKGQNKAVQMFNALRDHIDTATEEMYRGHGLNLTDMKALLGEYVRSIEIAQRENYDYSEKDEF